MNFPTHGPGQNPNGWCHLSFFLLLICCLRHSPSRSLALIGFSWSVGDGCFPIIFHLLFGWKYILQQLIFFLLAARNEFSSFPMSIFVGRYMRSVRFFFSLFICLSFFDSAYFACEVTWPFSGVRSVHSHCYSSAFYEHVVVRVPSRHAMPCQPVFMLCGKRNGLWKSFLGSLLRLVNYPPGKSSVTQLEEGRGQRKGWRKSISVVCKSLH